MKPTCELRWVRRTMGVPMDDTEHPRMGIVHLVLQQWWEAEDTDVQGVDFQPAYSGFADPVYETGEWRDVPIEDKTP